MKMKEKLNRNKTNLDDIFNAHSDLFRHYLAISPVLFVLLDRRGNVRFLNKRAESMLGVKTGNVRGKNWFTQFIPKENQAQVKEVFQQLLDGTKKSSESFENAIQSKEGQEKIIRWYNTVLRDEDGQIYAVVGFGEDVTEKKRTEEALIESERKLHSVIRTIPDIVYRLDEHGKIMFISESIRKYGYTPHSLLGTYILEYVHPDDRDRIHFNIRERRTGERRTQSVEVRLLEKRNHRKVTKKSPARIFLLDAEGLYRTPKPQSDTFIGTQGIARDVTDWKSSQTEASRLASVVEQASESIVITDTEGNIEYVNPFFEKTTGYTGDEVRGKNLRLLESGEHESDFYRIVWQTIQSGKSWEGTFTNRRKDGTQFEEDATIFPIFDPSNRVINYAAVKRDISDELKLKRQLQQAQKMEAVGQLAGGVAHDFNNILSVINGYSELALMGLDEQHPLYKKIREIHHAGQRAKELVDQLLGFSRRQIIEPKIINLNQLIPDLNKLLLRLLDEDISISFNFAEQLWTIKADPGQLEQILINLIVNARDAIRQKASRIGRKKISIETQNIIIDEGFVLDHPGSHEGPHVQLAVTDNGVGMSEEIRSKIFEPFFTTKRENEGTGLGLSTVYGIVKQNNGSIYVYSEPGLGAKFRIFWPADTVQGTVKSEFQEEDQTTGGSETILLVEDNQFVREFTHDALISLGYRVVEAENGLKALELVKSLQVKIDLLITDVIMPELGGRQLATRLNQIQPTKVLFTSGYTDRHIVNEGVLEEGVNFIQKPYTLNKLAAKIRKILD